MTEICFIFTYCTYLYNIHHMKSYRFEHGHNHKQSGVLVPSWITLVLFERFRLNTSPGVIFSNDFSLIGMAF